MQKIIFGILFLVTIFIVGGCSSALMSPKISNEDENTYQLPFPSQVVNRLSCVYIEADSGDINSFELCESIGKVCAAEIIKRVSTLYESKDGSCSGKIQSLVVSDKMRSCSNGLDTNMGCGSNVDPVKAVEPYYGDGSVNYTSYSRAKAICC